MTTKVPYRRPQKHLSEIVEEQGTGAATSAIRDLVEKAMFDINDAEQQERADSGKKKLGPYVTDARKCPRKVYFSIVGEEKSDPLTIDSLINFGVGGAVEEWLSSIFEKLELVVVREIRVEIPGKNGTLITGRVDFLVWVEITLAGGRTSNILIECKSTSSRAAYWMLKNAEPGKEDHRSQCNLYLHASRQGLVGKLNPFCERCDGKGVILRGEGEDAVEKVCRRCFPLFRTGILLYVVKDATKGEPPIHAFEVPYDRELAETDIADLSQIDTWAKEEEDPGIPAGYTKSKFPCSYCDYKTRCHGRGRKK